MQKISHNLILKHQSSFKIQHLEGFIVLKRMVVEAFKFSIQMHFYSITNLLKIRLFKEVEEL
jgi:hypothetical protein